jgi:hypothetical protein
MDFPGFGPLAEEVVYERKPPRCRAGEKGPFRPKDWDFYLVPHYVTAEYDAFCAEFLRMAKECDMLVTDDPWGFQCQVFSQDALVTFLFYAFQLDGGVETYVKHFGGDRMRYQTVVRMLNSKLGSEWGTIAACPPNPFPTKVSDDLPVLQQYYDHREWEPLFNLLSRKTQTYPEMFFSGHELVVAALQVPVDLEFGLIHKMRFFAELAKLQTAPELLAVLVEELPKVDVTDCHVRRFYLECAAFLAKRPEFKEDMKKLVPLAQKELEWNEMGTSCRCAAEILELCK